MAERGVRSDRSSVSGVWAYNSDSKARSSDGEMTLEMSDAGEGRRLMRLFISTMRRRIGRVRPKNRSSM